MAINYHGINFFDTGRFGDITVYTKKNGQIIYRIRHNRGGHGVKTFKTQCIRVRWANLVHLWQVLGALLKNAFSDKERTQTDCNRFMQVNFDQSDIYLTRQESKMGYCIASDIYVSSGKLPPICFTDGDNQWISDICVGTLQLTADTTVGELTRAIEAGGNPAFEGKDDLFVARLTQRHDTFESFDYCTATNPKIELRGDSRLRVLDIVEPGSLLTVEVDGRNYLALPCQEGVFTTLIHSHTAANDHVLTSTQRLMGKSQTQRHYQSAGQLLWAIESYGGVNDQNYYRYGSALDPMAELRKLAEAEASGGGSGSEGGGGNNGGSEEGEGGNEGNGGNGGGQTPQTVDITVACADPISGTPYGGGQLTPGTEHQIGVTPNFNWNFIRWNDGDTHNPRTITVPNENTTYTATLQLQDQQKSEVAQPTE